MPDDEPTSSTYAVGDPEDGFQVSSTFAPFTAAANPVGGPGGPLQPPWIANFATLRYSTQSFLRPRAASVNSAALTR